MSTEQKIPSEKCIKQRIQRHGSNIVLNKGRPTLSTSHKKNTRQKYINDKKLKKIENGTYRPRGRPKITL